VGVCKVVGCTIERMLRVNTSLKVMGKPDTAVSIHIAAGFQSTVFLLKGIGVIASEGWMHIFKHLHNSLTPKKLNISICGLEDSAW